MADVSESTSPAVRECVEKQRLLRIKLARIRLRRVEIQRKQWKVAELREKWLCSLQGIQFERSLIQEQRASVKSLAEHCATQLEATSQMNAANDCFYIWHAGPFGTINGFRLGRLPVETVEWHEINAALGQVALLLETIENETPLQLSLTLLPLGSYSQVAIPNSQGKVDEKSKRFNLYASDGGVLSFGQKGSFHKALEYLLQIIGEAGNYISEQDPAFRLPYAVSDGGRYINNIPITYGGSNSDELWTRALKFMLTDVKWIVAWAAKHAC